MMANLFRQVEEAKGLHKDGHGRKDVPQSLCGAVISGRMTLLLLIAVVIKEGVHGKYIVTEAAVVFA